MLPTNKPNVNGYWDFVKEQYPDARFNFWYQTGELLFYPNGTAEEKGNPTYSCFKKDGTMTIVTEF